MVRNTHLAHDLSAGHPEYSEVATDAKIDTLTGGPASCESWAEAWGAMAPCTNCEWRSQIKNPAVQLGAIVNVTPVGGDCIPPEPVAAQTRVPQWLVDMNARYAVARVGTSHTIADFRSPFETGSGFREGLGFMDAATLRALLRGRTVPPEQPGDKVRFLADAWLAHPGRRQYEHITFAPGDTVPPGVLNLWQGYAVVPTDGDVSPWLSVLAAVVPLETERHYVLQWLAWKVQNPGGVPDTLLIFVGRKGAGKNSLLDPVLTIFGRHGLLVDNPELIAGRFTGHLMTAALAVLDEAVFTGDPRQADAIKSRVTAKVMTYEQKGVDPVRGTNRCAYVMMTNHDHAWQATADERRAVVVDVGDTLRGDLPFWARYHAWAGGAGPAALLNYLQQVDVSSFNPRAIPKSEALRRQVEMTALRDPAAAWWFQCLTEGEIRHQGGRVLLHEAEPTAVDRATLRESFEQSATARGRAPCWAAAARKLVAWAGASGVHKTRVRGTGGIRAWQDVLPPLLELRRSFTEATQILFDD